MRLHAGKDEYGNGTQTPANHVCGECPCSLARGSISGPMLGRLLTPASGSDCSTCPQADPCAVLDSWLNREDLGFRLSGAFVSAHRSDRVSH